MKTRIQFGGGWQQGLDNTWTTYTEAQQDLCKRLLFPDNYADTIFTEHVLEHLPFVNTVTFMIESYRVLRTGGVFRVVMPMLDTVINARFNDENGKTYIRNSLMPHFGADDDILQKLNLPGLNTHPETFLINSMLARHEHRFVLSKDLTIQVLKSIGFEHVYACEIGQGHEKENCIERRQRGIYLGNDHKTNFESETVYDVESGIVEAIK